MGVFEPTKTIRFISTILLKIFMWAHWSFFAPPSCERFDVPSSRSFWLLIFLPPFPFFFLPSHFPRLIPYLGGYLWVHPGLFFLQWPKFAPSIISKRLRILNTQRSYFQTRMKDRLLEGSRILKVRQRSYIIGFPFHNFQNEELRFSTVFSLILLFFVFHKKSSDWTISIFFRKTFLFKLFIRQRRNADFMVRIISMALANCPCTGSEFFFCLVFP